jgi:hypothetical protein
MVHALLASPEGEVIHKYVESWVTHKQERQVLAQHLGGLCNEQKQQPVSLTPDALLTNTSLCAIHAHNAHLLF